MICSKTQAGQQIESDYKKNREQEKRSKDRKGDTMLSALSRISRAVWNRNHVYARDLLVDCVVWNFFVGAGHEAMLGRIAAV